MVVTSFVRKPDGRSVSMTDAGIWEVREIWQATFDGELTDPLAFLGDPMLPSLGDEHPDNPLLRLQNVPNGTPPSDGSLRSLNFSLLWSTSRMPPRFERDQYADPDRYSASWTHQVITEPVQEAYVSDDGGETFASIRIYHDPNNPALDVYVPVKKPIANTMGDKFIPGIERNRYLPVCRYSRNELFVPIEVLDLPGYVNDDVFTLDGVPVEPGQALITAAPVSAVKRYEEFEFRTIDYEIVLRPEGWDESILNVGFFMKDHYTQIEDPESPGDYITEFRGTKRCLVPNGDLDSEHEHPWVPSPEPSILNVDSIDLHFWKNTTHPRPNTSPSQYIGLLRTEEDFVPHYRVFRHLVRTSFGALGFI